MSVENEEMIGVLSEALRAIADAEERIRTLLITAVNKSPLEEKRYRVGAQSRKVAKNIEKPRSRILEFHAKGLHTQALADAIGVHRSTMRMYQRVLGLTPNQKPVKETLPRNRRRVPTTREQNEILKQNPWETEDGN